MEAALSTPERRRREDEEYENYFKVTDKDGNDVSNLAPPALKMFWVTTYHFLRERVRCAEEKHDREYAMEVNGERFELLSKMTGWYQLLVEQDHDLV